MNIDISFNSLEFSIIQEETQIIKVKSKSLSFLLSLIDMKLQCELSMSELIIYDYIYDYLDP